MVIKNDLIGWCTWQLSEDRLQRIDSMTGQAEPLPPRPHASWCYCGHCRPEEPRK